MSHCLVSSVGVGAASPADWEVQNEISGFLSVALVFSEGSGAGFASPE